MVRPREVAALVPRFVAGQAARPQPGRALRGSRLLSAAAAKPDKFRARLARRAAELGFDAFGIADADAVPEAAARLRHWLANGNHAGMEWMAERPERRASPGGLWPEVRSVILLGVNYGGEADVFDQLASQDAAYLAQYARRRDYHEVIKGRLKDIAGLIAAEGADVKVFVDTAPVLEKTLAEAAGLGWQGKNTMLISREHGDWLFLGAIYTTLPLPADAPGADHCGTCRRCLDVCPTDAFPSPYVLDARRCIAYLTIEHQGPIPERFRAAIGNRVFGCDDCLAICPWNKFAEASRDARLALRPALKCLPLAELAGLDDAAFRALFAGTPVKRSGRERFIRNVLVAIGNSGNAGLVASAERLLDDPSSVVRGSAVWALSRLMPHQGFAALAARHAREPNPEVQAEWAAALAHLRS